MRQCVFLGDREDQCAEEWRLMDTGERFFYSELDGEHEPNLSKRDVKKKSVRKLSEKHGAGKTHHVKLSSSLRQRRKSIKAAQP